MSNKNETCATMDSRDGLTGDWLAYFRQLTRPCAGAG